MKSVSKAGARSNAARSASARKTAGAKTVKQRGESATPPALGRPKDLGKRAAILAAAKRLFVSRGFESTSMDAVAAEAGVSKLTVYNHFTDKESLFFAAVEAACEAQLPHAVFEPAPASARRADIRSRLLAIATGFRALITSPEAIAVHRMMAAEARSSGQLGQLFYEAGPKRTLRDFELFLRDAMAHRELHIADPARAADHFFCMVKGVDHMGCLCGWTVGMTKRESALHLESVVDLFLRAFGRAR
jgi:TetR/AcrR family transcriptional regulator, mexJK operon transcriptional repressor